MTDRTKTKPGSISDQVQMEFDVWFRQVQALTPDVLNPEEWTGWWFDGCTPAEAIAKGPEPPDPESY